MEKSIQFGDMVLTGTVARINKLQKLMSIGDFEKSITVAEYLILHPETKTQTRTSKKGIELIKVTYPNARVVEYEVRRLDNQPCWYR